MGLRCGPKAVWYGRFIDREVSFIGTIEIWRGVREPSLSLERTEHTGDIFFGVHQVLIP